MLSDQIREAVDAVSAGYERLILLVGSSSARRSAALQQAAADHAWEYVNLSLRLAERMLELSAQERPGRAFDLVREILGEARRGVACLDNIELLFEPSLQLDPLALLQSLSRQTTLVVAWPGDVMDDGDARRLTHAESSHPEYREYPAQGLILLSVPAEE